jgi:predicted amidohydrolase YtcJ
MGRGWDQNDWPQAEFGGEFPVHEALSAVTPDHPVLLQRIGGHAALLNGKALSQCNVTASTEVPPGGAILRGDDGAPTGVLVDAAMSLAKRPDFSDKEVEDALTIGATECLKLGLVGVHDAGISQQTLDAYTRLYGANALPFRVYAMLTPSAAKNVPRPLVNGFDGLFTVRAIKRSMDGALGSRGAALLTAYSDQPNTSGLPQEQVDALASATAEALARGFQTCTHAIGDAGVRRVLDAYERAQGSDRSARLRIEHAQVIAPEDIRRFAALGILPSMQPTHATSDMPWAEARLGPERIKGAYAWRSLLDAGVVHLPLGSDFPVEEPNPLLGIYAAVTRLDAKGESPHGDGGWFPDQRLTRLEALRGFTLDAAYAAFQEQVGGSIRAGKWADLAVFDRDLLACPPAELLKAKVRLTIVAGKIAYEAP